MTNTYALVIEEPIPGKFLWSVVQPGVVGAKAVVVDFAMGPLHTEIAAVAACNAVLKRIKEAGAERKGGWGGNFAETLPGSLE